MVELSEEQARKIDYTMNAIIETNLQIAEIHTVLLGAKGEENGGLCNDVKAQRQDLNALSLRFWILVGILVGSGILGGSIWAALAH